MRSLFLHQTFGRSWRLPELMKDAIEILSAPAGFMPVLERIDCAIILLTERPFLS